MIFIWFRFCHILIIRRPLKWPDLKNPSLTSRSNAGLCFSIVYVGLPHMCCGKRIVFIANMNTAFSWQRCAQVWFQYHERINNGWLVVCFVIRLPTDTWRTVRQHNAVIQRLICSFSSSNLSKASVVLLLQVSTEPCARSPSTSVKSEDTPTSTTSHGTSVERPSPASGEQTELFLEKPRGGGGGTVAEAGMATTTGVLTNPTDVWTASLYPVLLKHVQNILVREVVMREHFFFQQIHNSNHASSLLFIKQQGSTDRRTEDTWRFGYALQCVGVANTR